MSGTEPRNQRITFAGSFEIDDAVAGHDAGKKTEVLGDSAGGLRIGSRHQKQRATFCAFAFQKREQTGMVRQCGGIKLDFLRNAPFKRGKSAGRPLRNGKKCGRPCADEKQKRLRKEEEDARRMAVEQQREQRALRVAEKREKTDKEREERMQALEDERVRFLKEAGVDSVLASSEPTAQSLERTARKARIAELVAKVKSSTLEAKDPAVDL